MFLFYIELYLFWIFPFGAFALMSSVSGMNGFNQPVASSYVASPAYDTPRPIDPETGKPMTYAKLQAQQQAFLRDQQVYQQASSILGYDIGMGVFQQAQQNVAMMQTPAQVNYFTGVNSQQQTAVLQQQLNQNLQNGNADPVATTTNLLQTSQAEQSSKNASAQWKAFTAKFISEMMNRKETPVKVTPPSDVNFISYD